MTNNVPDGRRRLDGPIRRPTPLQRDQSQALNVPKAEPREVVAVPNMDKPASDF